MDPNSPAHEPATRPVKNTDRTRPISEDDERENAERYKKAVEKLNRSGDKEIETALSHNVGGH